MVTAGWELYDHLEALSEPEPGTNGGTGISRALGSMHAVADQRMRFAVLARTYTQRASQYLGNELTAMTNAALQVHGGPHFHARQQLAACPALHLLLAWVCVVFADLVRSRLDVPPPRPAGHRYEARSREMLHA